MPRRPAPRDHDGGAVLVHCARCRADKRFPSSVVVVTFEDTERDTEARGDWPAWWITRCTDCGDLIGWCVDHDTAARMVALGCPAYGATPQP